MTKEGHFQIGFGVQEDGTGSASVFIMITGSDPYRDYRLSRIKSR